MRNIFSNWLAITVILVTTFLAFHGCRSKNDSQDGIKVMTYNIGNACRPCPSPERFAPIIKKASPDILLIQEANNPTRMARLAKLCNYNYLVTGDSSRHIDVAILSRYPMKFVGAMQLCPERKADTIVCAEIELPQDRLLACSVHLNNIKLKRSPQNKIITSKARLAGIFLREMFSNTERSMGAEKLVKWVRPLGYKNVIIGGDFNSCFLHKTARIMRQYFRDTSFLNSSLLSSSYKAPELFIPVKVDYIYLSDTLGYHHTEIIHDSPGDHYPVLSYIYFENDS